MGWKFVVDEEGAWELDGVHQLIARVLVMVRRDKDKLK